MKMILKVIAVFLLTNLTSSLLSAQTTKERLEEDITRAGGLFHSYEFMDIHDTKAPKGYKPFYVTHYGRHGCRYHESAVRFGSLPRVLHHADSIDNLTPAGKVLLSKVDSVVSAHEGMFGELTPKGFEEHKMIARRMSGRFPEVFNSKDRNLIDAYSSVVRRCVLSMTASTSTLLKLNPSLDLHVTASERIYPVMNIGHVLGETKKFFTPYLNSALASSIDWEQVAAKVYADPTLAIGTPFDLGQDIWNTWAICQCIEFVDIDILKYLTLEQLRMNWHIHSGYMYLRYMPSEEFGLRLHKGIAPLLEDFVTKADKAVAGDGTAATLRFGHDSTVMPLAAYMGLEGFTKVCSMSNLPDHWDFGTMVSMASNIQMIFYRNRENDVLVKFLYNEQEKTLPALKAVYGGVYYDWSAVREYFLSKM